MYEWDWSWLWKFRSELLDAILFTLGLNGVIILGGIVVGALFCALRASGPWWGRKPAVVLIEFFRAMPALVLMIWMFFCLPILLRDTFGYTVRLSGWTAAVIALSLNMGAYFAEIFRAGLAAIPRGEVQAGYVCGLSRWDITTRIIAPHALRSVLPPFANQMAAAIKLSSLASFIAVPEILYTASSLIHIRFVPWSSTPSSPWPTSPSSCPSPASPLGLSAAMESTMHDGRSIFFQVAGLHKRFCNRAVLDGVSFDLRKGQTAALIGASGSGKTTLLKCLAGMESYEQGEVRLDGRSFSPTRPRWFHPNPTAAQVGLVFQEYNLWATMTALDNLTLPLVKVKGFTADEAHERALSHARRFHLDHLVGRGVQQLSGGERQRFALLRAILLEPQVLLLDEITAALDVPMRCAVAEMLWELAASGITMILVSHEISFVRSIADVVLFLKDGRLCE